MSTNIDTAFETIVAPLEAEAREQVIAEIVETSANNVAAKEKVATGITAYEVGFQSFVEQVGEAIASGITLGELEDGFKADKAATGTKHFASSKSSLTYVGSLALFQGLPGDQPDDLVYRSPDEVVVPEGKTSLWTIVRAVCRTEGKVAIYKAANVEYGKSAIADIVAKAEDQQAAWDALVALKAKQDRAVKKAATDTTDTDEDDDEDEDEESKPKSIASILAVINANLAGLYELATAEDADLTGLEPQVADLELKAAAFALLVADEADDEE